MEPSCLLNHPLHGHQVGCRPAVPVCQTGRHVEKIQNGHLLSAGHPLLSLHHIIAAEAGNQFLHGLAEVEHSFLHQHHRGHRRDRLRHREHTEEAVPCHRFFFLNPCIAVLRVKGFPAVLRDSKQRTRRRPVMNGVLDQSVDRPFRLFLHSVSFPARPVVFPILSEEGLFRKASYRRPSPIRDGAARD